jgi:hypothetical protein
MNLTDTLTRTAQMRMAMRIIVFKKLGHLHHVHLTYAILFSTISGWSKTHMQSQARFELVSVADAVALGAEHPYDAGYEVHRPTRTTRA